MDLEQFKNLNKKNGYFFFSSGAMKFFKSNILDFDEKTGFFITSEKGPGMAREYKIRLADFESGNVKTIRTCLPFISISRARQEFRKLVRGL